MYQRTRTPTNTRLAILTLLIVTGPTLFAFDDRGLLLHYDFNAPGQTVMDQSGNGNDGQVIGARWVPVGIGGGALYLEEPSDGVLADDARLPFGDASRSVSWWFALDQLRPADNTEFINYGTFRRNQFVALAIDWRHGRDCPSFSQYGGAYLSGRRIDQTGVWYHAVFTYGGNGRYTYYFREHSAWPDRRP